MLTVLDRTDEALAAVEESLRIDPNNTSAQELKDDLLREVERWPSPILG